MRVFLLFPVVALLLSCAHAVSIEDGKSNPPIVFEAPPDWSLVTNRRVLKNRLVVFETQEGCCFVRIESIVEGKQARSLPLDVLADADTLSRGRSLGLNMELQGSQDILVAGRRAWATTYRFTHGPHSRQGSNVYMRAGPYLVVVTLQGVDDMSPQMVVQWGQFLETLDLPNWPAPEETLFSPESDPEMEIFLGE